MITALTSAGLIGAMILFNVVVTPVIFTRLDAGSQTLFLRSAFPRLFLFGLVMAAVISIAANIEDLTAAAGIAALCAASFALNTWVVTPAINRARDSGEAQTTRFHLLHGLSMVLFTLNLIALVVIIYLAELAR